ncbi:hypothetical protein [Inconstantimicrobium mannanitabidum]|uniref:Uncharacterized protein n=1 Tax=Inconstantimicrobium mannanitabidum TaxID=1604901 RepID=A0ACB5RDT0_9CLOT|nr:hypothetical protein [Clostridium sp. TW13]GKX67425.1 hypothetical protein rsdtw13_26830 [Clostridium sp. TW13]
MKRKIIAGILILSMVAGVMGCKSSKDNTTKTPAVATGAAQSNDNKDQNAQSTSTDTNQDNNDENKAKKLTSPEIIKKFEELRPKVTAFLKEKLEKPNVGKGDEFKVYEKSNDVKIKDFSGVSYVEYNDHVKDKGHYSYGAYSISAKEKDVESTEAANIVTDLWLVIDEDKIEKEGFKIQGTLFEEFIKLVSTDTVDIAGLEKEVSAHVTEDGGVTKQYGNTEINFRIMDSEMMCTITIE